LAAPAFAGTLAFQAQAGSAHTCCQRLNPGHLLCVLQELAPEDDDVQDTMATIDGLLEQQTYQLIGWPGLSIVANPCEWCRKAWEACSAWAGAV
jgi:hypothetical protein